MKQQKYYNHNFDVGLISDVATKLGLHEKVVEVLFSRGYTTSESIIKFLSPSENDFHDPFLLNGMKEARDIILNAVRSNKRILVFGDYDVDGMSATAIMFKTFQKLGKTINYYLPNRFVDGYGLTNEVVDKLVKQYNPELIITVDCGISCKKEVDYAKSLGIEMIVTDHHEPPEEIPNCVVINAKIKGQSYPFSELCGTGVAFKIAQALLGGENAMEFLPIAAVATIADIVSLTDENRAIVTLGLQNFERDMPLGYKYLFQENKLKFNKLSATDIAFKIAPKLNSSGRMGDPCDSLKLMISDNVNEIKQLIKKINFYNTKRQKVCNDCFEDCLKILSKEDMSKERAIILANNKWDHGILGIVAARLVDKFNRPTFLFSEDDGVLKGSARSLMDINVHEILSDLDDILVTYGGHKMAAGLTLAKENFKNFCSRVNSFIFSHVSPDVFEPISYYDIELSVNEITDKFLCDLQKLEPFGLNNSNPLIKLSTKSANIVPLKSNNNHFNITINGKLELIYFNCLEKYFNLKYSTNKHFIFELQSEKSKNMYNGIVKNFDGDFEFDNCFKENLNALCLKQLTYNAESEVRIVSYKESDIVNYIAELTQNPFGTIFVCNDIKRYNEFIKKYDLSNIYKCFIFDKFSMGGFNAISVYPTEIEIFRDYSKIVFIDPVLEKSFLSEIAKVSSATFYIPTDIPLNVSIFQDINLDRKTIGNFYNQLKTFENKKLLNELQLYNKMSKLSKISFKNFYVYLLIFEELGLISLNKNDGLKISILETSKKELTSSILFNRLKLNQQIFRKAVK